MYRFLMCKNIWVKKPSGWLPNDMCNNPNIKILSLSENQLEGQIPLNIWKCRQLEVLSLSYNNFNGNIPFEIGRLSMLTMLFLGYNHFRGTNIPSSLNVEFWKIAIYMIHFVACKSDWIKLANSLRLYMLCSENWDMTRDLKET